MEEIIFFLQFTEYKDETVFGSDIPLRWFMDVIVVCLFILIFTLSYKFIVACIRFSFYMSFERKKYKEVLEEAVNVSQTLLELYDDKSTKDENSENQWYITISKAYRSLGQIEKINKRTKSFHRDKKRIANIYSSLNAELKKFNSPKKGKDTMKVVAQSLRNVNKAIVDYMK